MFPVSKILLRGAVVGALGLGTAVVIAGPDRIGSLFTQARSSINDKIDKNITDPVALRAQLKSLASQYPKRIGEVRGDLAQLKEQQAQLNRDLAVSNRVMALADSDLDKLSTAISHAETAQIQAASFGPATDGGMVDHKVVIVFKGEKLEVDQAQVKSNQITATRNAYAQRAADIQRDLGYLAQQERQMSQLLSKLEAEYTSFQTQMFDLDRQIDSIARNDRMIDIIKDRQDTLNDQSRYRAASLDQITSKLADIRARQEATLESLARTAEHFSYEDAAKAQIDRESSVDPSGARTFGPARSAPRTEPTIIEINPDKLPKVEKDGPVAAR
jgi:chromosome segregation ATPase